jgi:hypothetical protein
LPDGWDIAGWEHDGEWFNTEEGDRVPQDAELADSEWIVVSYLDDDEVLHYWSIMDGVDEYDGLIDAIAELADVYGVPA